MYFMSNGLIDRNGIGTFERRLSSTCQTRYGVYMQLRVDESKDQSALSIITQNNPMCY